MSKLPVSAEVLFHHASVLYSEFVPETSWRRGLSVEVLELIKPSLVAQQRLDPASLSTFVSKYRSQILTALRDYGPGSALFETGAFAYSLFGQPECLILWERIHTARLALTATVRGRK
ncbi:Uncharacterised protein [Mycobacteroides abscessus subsp. massiliense]|uniref:hypothetical protein n=1 Tax=Mycobacteroides abscessus TaxID=36809 RepID=UPI0009A7189B|nr:hypothetical protein [Mycobacteroides abscessus]MBE5502493.1 hypothetical protein [Mycobacteroides abscessus]SLH51643.1 Uncharacterised protein [Mycobacteroides abscessus subsp. massiliense]